MNENQKKVLIAAGIGLAIWSGYRLYIKRPIPPMRPVKDTLATDSVTNFTGYSDMTGGKGRTLSPNEMMEAELKQINTLLDKGQGHLTTSQINKLRARKKQLQKGRDKMIMLITDGTPNPPSYGGDEQSNG
jgi:hypothetical protein